MKDVFNPLRDKIKIAGSKIGKAEADYLFYSLIDMIVDNYFVVMEKFGEKIETLEEDIIRQSRSNNLIKNKYVAQRNDLFKTKYFSGA